MQLKMKDKLKIMIRFNKPTTAYSDRISPAESDAQITNFRECRAAISCSIVCRTIVFLLLLICITTSFGCYSTNSHGTSPGLILFVPGATGDGSMYKHVVPALRDNSDQRTIQCFDWGAPAFAFFLNYSNESIHADAEKKLAQHIISIRTDHPKDTLDIIAHSAGGGVTLGALAKLPSDIHVNRVILLHPSVSPDYPLATPLNACESINLFYSHRDKTFLEWRTSTFGTYDNIKTKAAGHLGFNLAVLSEMLLHKIKMHAHIEADQKFANDGGHWGPLSRPFLRECVIPLLARIKNKE